MKAAVTDYLVGEQLDEALRDDQDIVISWPFAKGDVADWTQAEAIWCAPAREFPVLTTDYFEKTGDMSSLISSNAGVSKTSHPSSCLPLQDSHASPMNDYVRCSSSALMWQALEYWSAPWLSSTLEIA